MEFPKLGNPQIFRSDTNSLATILKKEVMSLFLRQKVLLTFLELTPLRRHSCFYFPLAINLLLIFQFLVCVVGAATLPISTMEPMLPHFSFYSS